MNKLKCPRCKKDNLVKSGKIWVAQKKIQQYRCNDCGYRALYPLGVGYKGTRGGKK